MWVPHLRSSSSFRVVERGVHLVGGAHGAQRVVLVHLGRSERGDDGVADELLHRAAVAFDGVAHRLVVARHHAPERLGVEAFAERGRADDVGEHDRHGRRDPVSRE